MKKPNASKAISLFLAMWLLCTSAFFPAAQAETSSVAQPDPGETYVEPKSEEQLQAEQALLVHEIESLREENVKHFQLADGTYQAVVYANPVHRLNADGEWVDIDNSLAESGSEISTGDARVKFTKKITGNGNVFTIHDHSYKITVGLKNAIKKTEGAYVNASDGESKQLKYDDLKNISANVIYENILDGVDLEYILISNSIKENIIVKEKKEQYSYTFTIELNGLTAQLNNNAVYLCDKNTGEMVYQIPQPYMFDATGEMSTDVLYTLTSSGNGKYALTVEADENWVNAEERTFPVTIDPVMIDYGQTADTYVYSAAPSTNYGSSQYLWVLDTAEAYIKFADPVLPEGAAVTNADLRVPFYYNVENGKYLKMRAYPITSSWSEYSVTWNTKPSTGTELGYSYLYANGASSTAPEYCAFTVTSYVHSWYNGTTNYGFALRREGGENTSVLLVSKERLLANARLYITYSGSDLGDGIYAIQKKDTQAYMKTTRQTYGGTVTQDITNETTPNTASDLDNLFKIAYRPGNDDYVIRSMVDNSLLIYANTSSNTVAAIKTSTKDASLGNYYTWEIDPADGGGYYISSTYNGTTYYLRSNSIFNNVNLVLTTNIEDSGVVWKFNFYDGTTLEKALFANVRSSITVGESYITTGYMYSTRIGHNGPVSFTVVNTDGTTTDKATVTSGGTFKALKPGQVKLRITYPGAPYYWVQYVTIKSAGCKEYNPITSVSDPDYKNMNCHGYAFWSVDDLGTWHSVSVAEFNEFDDSNDLLAHYKAQLEANWLNQNIGAGYWEDVTNSGGINAELEDNQWLVVMRAGLHKELGYFYGMDFHFWYRTDTGEWANKHSYDSYSEKLGDDLPTDNDSIGWNAGDYENYYDSDLVYYRVTEKG